MTYKEVIAALRSAPSRSKRELFDTAADMIERLTQDKTVVSNADRIRAMSDEELAVFLWSFDVVDIAMEEDGTALLRPKLTKWLQQPADHAEVASDVLMRPNGEEDA